MQVSQEGYLDDRAVRSVQPARLEAITESLVGVDVASDLAEMFRLLGDPTRVRILFALLEAGELCVSDLAAAVDTNETKVSHAMRLLRNAGVVRNRRDGRNVYYHLHDSHVCQLLELSQEHVRHVGEDG